MLSYSALLASITTFVGLRTRGQDGYASRAYSFVVRPGQVSKLGVTSILVDTRTGVNAEVFEEGLLSFAQMNA